MGRLCEEALLFYGTDKDSTAKRSELIYYAAKKTGIIWI